MIKWNEMKHTREDYDLFAKIANRAVELYKKLGHDLKYMTVEMDLQVVHHTRPLKLQEMLDSDNGNFGHDIAGINRHLNRDTGEMEDAFTPRFTA